MKRNLQRRFSRPKLKHLKQIAIDEIRIGKGHRCLTIVLALATGAVVFVGDGKSGETLLPFWRRLKRSKAKVEAVAIDMSTAYISAFGDHLPQAVIGFDHFHVVKLFNDKLSEPRRTLYPPGPRPGQEGHKGDLLAAAQESPRASILSEASPSACNRPWS